jgi:hypothetical protein
MDMSQRLPIWSNTLLFCSAKSAALRSGGFTFVSPHERIRAVAGVDGFQGVLEYYLIPKLAQASRLCSVPNSNHSFI